MHEPSRKRFIQISVLVTIIVLALASFSLYKNITFHITKTDPATSEVSIYSPYIKVYFNNKLDAKSVKIEDYGALFGKRVVNDKTLTLYFNRALLEGKTYAFIIKSVQNTDGEAIQNTKIEFTAQKIAVSELTKEQQSTIIGQQDKYPYAPAYVSYPGFTELTSQGVTSGQLQSIKQATFDYSGTIKREFRKVTLDPATVNIVFHDPTARNPNGSSATFSLTMGNEKYTARAEYVNLDNDVYTRIYNAAGVQVYDSNTQ